MTTFAPRSAAGYNRPHPVHRFAWARAGRIVSPAFASAVEAHLWLRGQPELRQDPLVDLVCLFAAGEADRAEEREGS